METIFFDFLARRSSFPVSWKRIFSTNASFRVVETDSLASTNHFLYIFSEPPARQSFFLPSGNESFIPAIGEGYFRLMKTLLHLKGFFTSRNRHCCEWKPVFKDRNLFLLVETDFLARENHFLPLSHIFFKKFFIPISGKVFFSPKNSIVFIQGFLTCLPLKPLFKVQRSLFKTLITAIGNHFL